MLRRRVQLLLHLTLLCETGGFQCRHVRSAHRLTLLRHLRHLLQGRLLAVEVRLGCAQRLTVTLISQLCLLVQDRLLRVSQRAGAEFTHTRAAELAGTHERIRHAGEQVLGQIACALLGDNIHDARLVRVHVCSDVGHRSSVGQVAYAGLRLLVRGLPRALVRLYLTVRLLLQRGEFRHRRQSIGLVGCIGHIGGPLHLIVNSVLHPLRSLRGRGGIRGGGLRCALEQAGHFNGPPSDKLAGTWHSR